MALKWRNKISILDIKRGNVSVTLEQVNDTNPDDIKIIKIFSVSDALIDTPERKQQVIDELERQFHAEKQRKIDEDKIIGSLADDITIAVVGWEAS